MHSNLSKEDRVIVFKVIRCSVEKNNLKCSISSTLILDGTRCIFPIVKLLVLFLIWME